MLAPSAVADALARIAPHIHRTPLLSSARLNAYLGHDIIFKAEGFQKIGAFKIRGALNALLTLQEQGRLPQKIVAFSSGNHAQAAAYVGRLLGIPTTVVMPRFVSTIKQQATLGYGAELILTDTRPEAEALAARLEAEGAWLLHPSAHPDVIAGQGTACLEALQDATAPDAIFAACGGGGLLAGTWLAAQTIDPKPLIFGVEPRIAGDAAESYRSGKIVSFVDSPMTVADGARTLHVSELTFEYLQRLSGFYEIEEQDIIYWTQWLMHLLKIVVEPTAALAMAGAAAWLSGQTGRKRALVILSGANVGTRAQQELWAEDYLARQPG